MVQKAYLGPLVLKDLCTVLKENESNGSFVEEGLKTLRHVVFQVKSNQDLIGKLHMIPWILNVIKCHTDNISVQIEARWALAACCNKHGT